MIGTTLKSFYQGASYWVTQKSNLTIGKVIKFAQYTNKLYITNGTEQPFIVDVANPTSNVFIGIAPPDLTNTVFTPISSGGAIQYRGNFDASFGKFPATGMVQIVTLYSGGAGYAVNDILNVIGGAGGCQVQVLTVLAGIIQTIKLYAQGLGYSVASGVSTSGGSGNGCTVNITEIIYGSGTAGAIAENDSWLINVAGTIGGIFLAAGHRVIALIALPTDSDWLTLAMEYGGRLYAFVYRDADGNVSSPSYSVYVATTGAINSVQITGVPVTQQYIDLYRSAVNSPTLYLLTTLSQSDTTYTDTDSDTALQLQYPLSDATVSLPVTAQQVLIKNDKLFFGNVGYEELGGLYDPINGSGMYVDLVTGVATGLEKSSTYKYLKTYLLNDGTETTAVKDGNGNMVPFATIATGTHTEAKAKIAIDMWFPVVASQSGIVGSKFNIMFATSAMTGGLLYSIDGGATWSLNTTVPSVTVNGMLKIGTSIFLATSGGVYVSADNGLIFTASSSGMTNTNVLCLYYDGTYLYAGCSSNISNAYISSNLGVSWTGINNANLINIIGFVVVGTYLYSLSNGSATVWYSTNHGTSWITTSVPSGLGTGIASDGTYTYVGYNATGVYRFTGTGADATLINTGLANIFVTSICSNGTQIYAGTTSGGVFSLSGTTWSDISIVGLTDWSVTSLGFSGTRLFAGVENVSTHASAIYFSDDGGTIWSLNSTPTTTGALNSVGIKPDSQFTPDYFIVGSYFYPSVTGVKIYRTKANGSTYYYDQTILLANWNTAMESGFTDAVPDASLTVPYVDPTLTVTNYPSRIVWSEDAKLQTFLALSFLDAYADDGDVITGLVDDKNGILIYKTNSILKLYTDGAPQNWVPHKLVSGTGCSDPNSLVVTKKGNFFAHNDTICQHQSEGTEALIISTLFRDTINSVTSYMQATYNTLNEWVIFPVNIGSENWLLIYDTKLPTWYKFQVPLISVTQWCALSRQLGTDVDKILMAGDTGGRVGFYDVTLNTGLDMYPSTTNINVHARTKIFDFPLGVELVRPRKLWINESVKTGESITHTLGMPDANLSISTTETGQVGTIEAIVTDSMLTGGGAKVTSLTKFYYDIKGTLLDRFLGLKFEGTVLNRGRRG